MISKPLPSNSDAERALLGGILVDPSVMPQVRARVRPETFFGDVHRRVYASMLSLDDANSPIDLVSVAHQLGADLERIGGNAAIMDIASHVPTAAGVDHYVDMLAKLATRRALIQAAGRVVEDAYNDDLTPQDAASRIEAVESGSMVKAVTMGEAIKGAVRLAERYHKSGGMLGIPSGYEALDRMTAGFCGGDLVVIAARSGHGKSALALDLAVRMARAGKHVGYLNLEMLVDRFTLRALSAESGVGYRKLRGQQGKTRDDLTLMTSAASSLEKLPLVFWGQDAIDISDFAAECRMQKARGQLDAVFVDYAQLLRHRGMGHGASREQYVAAIIHALKSMAMRLSIPVFALAQLNRQNDTRLDKRPTLSDLRETSAFEHAATCIMLLHSPIKYAKDEKEKAALKGKLEVCIAKNRDGPTGQVDVHLDHETMAITERWMPPGERVEF